jgi:hypothetical protein
LDSEGKCVYTKNHDEDPLPIDALRSASKDVEEARFLMTHKYRGSQ